MKKVGKMYLKVVETISVFLMAMILLLMVIQIVCRLFTIGQNFTEELARLCFSLMIFIAAPLCLTEGADICVDMVVAKLPLKVRKAVDVFAFSLIAIFSFIALYSEILVMKTNVDVTAVSMTWIQMNWLYAAFTLSFGFLFVTSIWKIIATLKNEPQTYDINADEKAKAIEKAKELDLGI